MTPRERKLMWLLLGIVGAVAVARGVGFIVDKAHALIKRWEGLRLDAYQDVAGLWTIGYGHLIKPGERYHPYGPVTRITEAEADALLDTDMFSARAAVDRAITRPMTEGERAAMVSLAFNIGGTAFQNSTLARKFNAGDTAGAAAEFARWNRAGGSVVQGLINRRAAEQEVFNA